MKRFVFRLASVLRIREFELDRARLELSKLEQERHRREGVVASAAENLERGREILAAEIAKGVDAERLAMRADGVTVGRIEWQRAQIAVAELEPGILAARERVRKAHTQVKSLDRLRQNREESHRRESLAAEQAELEELAIARIARRMHQDSARGGRGRGAEEVGNTR